MARYRRYKRPRSRYYFGALRSYAPYSPFVRGNYGHPRNIARRRIAARNRRGWRANYGVRSQAVLNAARALYRSARTYTGARRQRGLDQAGALMYHHMWLSARSRQRSGNLSKSRLPNISSYF